MANPAIRNENTYNRSSLSWRNWRKYLLYRDGEAQDVSFWRTINWQLVFIVGLLVSVGMMMVYSTTFDWSFQTRGSATAIFMEDHVRNIVFGVISLAIFYMIDYRFWRRFSLWLLLATIGALIAVWLFGQETFGARRSLIGGRFQPGELAEFAIVLYLAAWLSSKREKIQSLANGLLPFLLIVGVIAGLIALQPDFSSASVIALTASAMYFLAGGRVIHMVSGMVIAATLGLLFVQTQPYALQRVADYNAGLVNRVESNYHTQQAVIAFVNGGWTGVGLGQGKQKFNALPAPHTDSIFAVIGEELGVLGASAVLFLFAMLGLRGYSVSRRAVDSFGSLLVAGFTTWIMIRALLNIAVMTGTVPSSGVPLPFVSYGGSALFVLMISIGLMLSVHRVSVVQRIKNLKRRSVNANYDRGWGDRRSRLPRSRRRRSFAPAEPN